MWAFDEVGTNADYELPVIAFVGLDLSWQAYLFYTINIKPKRINASLAYDLYPLLRTEQWLEKLEATRYIVRRDLRSSSISSGPTTRALGITESHARRERAEWTEGDPGCVGSARLMSSFVKSWKAGASRLAAFLVREWESNKLSFNWSLNEQAAFLIFAGDAVRRAIASIDAEWATALRHPDHDSDTDLAFVGHHNLLNQDQGIRTLMQVINDLFYVNADELQLHSWHGPQDSSSDGHEIISEAIRLFSQERKVNTFMKLLAEAISSYDWRASGYPGLSALERTHKASFRGSGGYRELRRDLLAHLARGPSEIAESAETVFRQLGFDDDTLA